MINNEYYTNIQKSSIMSKSMNKQNNYRILKLNVKLNKSTRELNSNRERISRNYDTNSQKKKKY